MKIQRWAGRYIAPLFFEYDTVTLRIMLAACSLFFAVSLMMSHVPLTKEAYSIMVTFADWFMPEDMIRWFWILVFILHFVGIYIVVVVQRNAGNPAFKLAVNIYGAAIWLFSTISIWFALGYWPPTTAMETVNSALALWALRRTGVSPERLIR